MNIILEIGLNHLGSINKLNQIFINTSSLKFKFSLTLQIIDQNFFIKNKILKYYLPEKYLLDKLLKFKIRTNNQIGIATNYKIDPFCYQNIKLISLKY